MTSEATDICNVNPIDINMGIDIGRGSGVGWHVKLHGIASKGIASKVIATSSVKEREMAATVLRRGVNVLSRCPHPGVGACSTPPMLVLASQSIPSRFLTVLHAFYCNYLHFMKLGGESTASFTVKSGVRQG